MALTLTFNQPGIPAGDLDRGRTDILTTDAGGGRAPLVSIEIGDVPPGSVVLVQALDEPPASSPLLTQVSDALWTLDWNAGAWGPFRIQATASIGTEVVSSVTRRISVRSPTFHLAYPSLSERYDPNAHLVPTVPSVQLTEMNEHSTNRALVDFHREVVQAIDTLSAGGIDSIPDGSITEDKLDPAYSSTVVVTDGTRPMVASFDAGTHPIVHVGAPVAPTDAARLQDADYLAGAGLLRTDHTIDVVAHADGSIIVGTDSVQVGTLASDAQHGTRGGGTQHATVTTTTPGFASAADKTKLDGIAAGADVTTVALAAATAPISVNSQRITNLGAPVASTDAARVQDLLDAAVIAGAGLLRAGTTLNVVADVDASIVVAADSLKVGVLATDAQHGTRGGGTLHATVTTTTPGFASAADKSKLDGIAAGADVTTVALAAASAPVSVNGQRITNLGTPTAATDAATRAYVDAAPPVLHASTHADGGADELSVAGLSGLLADPQTAGGLKTATTTVAIAAAAAPAADTALMATSSTAAAWRVPPSATTGVPGYMSAADKLKLDGVATSAAAVGSAAASQVTVATAAPGSAATAARSDHVHSVATAAPSALTVGGAQAPGTSTSLARADHAHAMPALVTTSVDGFMAATDKTRLDGMASSAAAVGSTAATQVTVTTAGPGSAATAARSDHVHSVATAAPSALTVGGAQAPGTSTSLARADHAHAMPALVTTSVDGFMVSTDKSKLDGIEAGAQVTSFARVQTALGLASSAVSFNAQRLSSVLDPSAAQDAATKAYVDAIAQGLDVKASVRLVATTNVAALTGNVSIDGSTTAPGQRVLLAGQTTASANGIYLTAAGAWARTTDADTSAKVTSGMYVFVTEGTANANSGWALITPDPIVLGTTALTFSQVTGAGQLTAGAGMTKSGNQLDVVAHADGSIIVAADSVQLGVIATDAQHGARAGGTTHAAAIAGGASGFLTGSDKTKLDGIATAAAAVGSTTPVAADVTAAASGSATTAARSDHRHQVSAGSPVALTLAAATADGTSTSLARADHVHALPASSTTPTALTVGGAGSAGSSTSISKADHVHAMPATATTGADGFMASGDKSRLDALVASYKTAVRVASNAHIPNVDVPGNQPNVVDGISLAIGDRILVKDQVTVTYANNIYSVTTVGTGSNGTWAKAADADATGELVTGSTVYVAEGTQAGQWWQLTTLGAITIGTTAQAWARKTTPLATTAPASVGTAAAVGVGTTAARADHVHAHGAQTDGTLHAAATTSVAGFLSTADKTKLDGVATSAAALTSTAPSNVAAAAVVGVGTTAARFDHVHAHGAQTDGTLHAAATTSVAGFLSAADKLKLDGVAAGAPALASTAPANVAAAAVVGVGTTAARADHVHAHGAQTDGTLHAAATTSVAGFLSAADKTRLDALRARSYFDVRLATATTLPAYTATTISTNRPRLTATSNGALSIDGVAVVAGDLVLVLFESAANCGVYEVIAAGAAGTPYQLDLAYSGAYTAAVSGSQMIVRTGTAGTAYCNREFRPSSTSSGRFAEIPGPLQVWPRDVTPPTTIYPGWLYEIDALGSPISLTLVSPTGAADVLSGVSFGLNLTDSNATITITPTLGSHINGPADTNINPTATTFAAPRCATLQWVCGRGYTLYNPEHPYWRPVAAVADAATALGVGTTALVLLGGGAPTAGDVLTATSTSGASFAAPAADPSANGCRLSPTADDSPAADGTYSTIYLAPSKSDRIALYDGTNWRLYQVSSVSYAVTGRTTDLPFDIFAAQTAGVVSLEVVNWTSSTVRATAIARLNGVWTKSGDSTRRYLGTCRPRSATTYHLQTNGNDTTPAKCDLWNVDNQITAAFRYARSWTPETFTHPTASTWVGANGSSSRFEFIQGVAGSWTRAQAYAAVQTKTFVAVTGIGYDTVSTPSGTRTRVLSTNTNDIVTANGQYSLQSAIGVHYLAWIIYATNVAVVWWAAQSTHESGLEIAFQW